mmetsp:Transcript_144839/g.252558  ORF Transcript_144839/g.252558 Transcript_144839/m.252558 type:complete len:200 (-) Transcript_144839:1053-1652(-)
MATEVLAFCFVVAPRQVDIEDVAGVRAAAPVEGKRDCARAWEADLLCHNAATAPTAVRVMGLYHLLRQPQLPHHPAPHKQLCLGLCDGRHTEADLRRDSDDGLHAPQDLVAVQREQREAADKGAEQWAAEGVLKPVEPGLGGGLQLADLADHVGEQKPHVWEEHALHVLRPGSAGAVWIAAGLRSDWGGNRGVAGGGDW